MAPKQITWGDVTEAIQDIVSNLANDSSSVNFTYDDANATLVAAVIDNSSVQKSIYTDGTSTSTRQEAKFTDGPGINVEIADDSSNDRAEIVVKNTGVVNANNNDVAGTHFDLLSAVATQGDGSKTLEFKPLKTGNNKVSISDSDSGQSLTINVEPGNININEFDIQSPLGVLSGGTGGSTAVSARQGIGAAKTGQNSDITGLTGLTTPLSIDQGGTGGGTASVALKNLVGLNSVADVSTSGQSLVASSQNLVSGAYRAEIRGLKPAAGNTVTVATDGNDLTISAVANNILDDVTGARNINGARITNAADPINGSDLATRQFVEGIAAGLGNVKTSARAATTGALPASTYNSGAKTLTANASGALVVDGVSLQPSDRLLVKNQANAARNGIYDVTNNGGSSVAFILTRSADFDNNTEIGAGAFAFVEEGTVNTGKSFIQSTSNPVLDTDDLVFSLFGDNTIANDSITNSKLSDMPQTTLKGRADGAGSGDPTDLNANQVVGVINQASTPLDLAVIPHITNAKIVNAPAATVKGRVAGSGTGAVSDLSADEVVGIVNTSSVDIDASVIPTITNAKLAQANEATLKGRIAGSGTGAVSDLTSDQVIAVINAGSSTLDPALMPGVTNAKLAQMPTTTVKGRAAGSGTGTPIDMTAEQVVGVVNTSSVDLDVSVLPEITDAKLTDMTEATIKGRAAGAGTGDPGDLTANQVIAIANTASQALDTALIPTITNSKLANAAAATIKGRVAGSGSGAIDDLTADELIAVINAGTSATINSARLNVATPTGNVLVAQLNNATVALDSGTY